MSAHAEPHHSKAGVRKPSGKEPMGSRAPGTAQRYEGFCPCHQYAGGLQQSVLTAIGPLLHFSQMQKFFRLLEGEQPAIFGDLDHRV